MSLHPLIVLFPYSDPQTWLAYCYAPVIFWQIPAADWSVGLRSLSPQTLLILVPYLNWTHFSESWNWLAYCHAPVIFCFLRQNPTLGVKHCLTGCLLRCDIWTSHETCHTIFFISLKSIFHFSTQVSENCKCLCAKYYKTFRKSQAVGSYHWKITSMTPSL